MIGDVAGADGATDPALIVLVSGPPASGKSTIARRLAEGFERSAHLKVDELREIMVNGFEPPGTDWTPGNERQFRRARAAATLIARLHAADGVTVVIDDVCVPAHFEDHYADLFAEPVVRRVMLKPTWVALVGRMRARQGPWDELLLSSGAAAWCYDGLERLTLENWLVLDSSGQSAEETAEEVRRSLVRSSPEAPSANP